jgi:riboflavin synthase
MYTGIIQGTCEVVAVKRRPEFLRFAVRLDNAMLDDLQQGASVAIDGICQTVTGIQGNDVWFDAMAETLSKTTLSVLKQGDRVNVERSTRIGQENGGHEISGHVDGMLEIIHIEQTDDNCIFTLQYPAQFRPYIFEKGFLSIHGASLTVAYLDKEVCTFKVYLIPETLRLTNLGRMQTGDKLNFEIDRRTQAIVDTVTAFLQENISSIQQQVATDMRSE